MPKISQDLSRKLDVAQFCEISQHRLKDLQRLNYLPTILVSVAPHKQWVAEMPMLSNDRRGTSNKFIFLDIPALFIVFTRTNQIANLASPLQNDRHG